MIKIVPEIAVLGCGYWGKNLVRNFAELGALVAICDENDENAKTLSTQYDVAIKSWDSILADSSIDGVVIATPAVTHADLTIQALEAGKHVFVEKPMAVNLDSAKMVQEAVQKTSKTLMVGHLLLYHPAFLKLKDMVQKGDLGRLQYVYSNRMNFGKVRREENILWSFAPHDISMILSLTGEEPSTVNATGSNFLHNGIEDVTITHLEFESGVKGHIFVSWLHPYKEQKLVVIGDQGMIVFDDSLPWSEKLKFYAHKLHWENGLPVPDKADYEAIPLDEAEPLKLECQHFLECIENGTEPASDHQEGLRVLSVLERAQNSLNKKKVNTQNDAEGIHYFNDVFVHDTSQIDKPASIGKNTKIWHYSHILKNTKIGQNCTIGQNVMIGPDVVVGDNCKIQNNVSIYKGITIEDGVFCGPSCVFTNVINPRAEIERKDEFKETLIQKGATIGANSTILCGITIGQYALIGAGAVVTKDVPAHAKMVGNPAQQMGWVTKEGISLDDDLKCPTTGTQYIKTDNGIEPESFEAKSNV